MSHVNPIISGSKLQRIIGKVLDRLDARDGTVSLVQKQTVASPHDKALSQKPKVRDVLFEILPHPAVFSIGYQEVMAEQGIILTGDYKVVVSTLFSIENDSDGNPISYEWKEGDIVLYKNVKWRVYMKKTPAVDSTMIATILFVRKEAGDGYTPA